MLLYSKPGHSAAPYSAQRTYCTTSAGKHQRCCKYLGGEYNKYKYKYLNFLPSTFRVLFGLEFRFPPLWQQETEVIFDNSKSLVVCGYNY